MAYVMNHRLEVWFLAGFTTEGHFCVPAYLRVVVPSRCSHFAPFRAVPRDTTGESHMPEVGGGSYCKLAL
jgi:hypothetical protein